MNITRYFIGVFAVIGNWPNWERYFDLSRNGLKVSFAALAAALPALYLISYAVARQRAAIMETEFTAPAILPFLAITVIFLLSFAMLALMITMIFDRQDRFRPWVITRHWAVFFLSAAVAALFGLTLISPLPFALANGAAFAAFMGMLAIDIRLIRRVVDMNWGASILLGCVIIAASLTLLQLGLAQLN